ncbi:ABC transporter ATP-binding protein [Bacillus sp. JJ1562]|uniref:ABC transporter ATP-binding protein n=1 Tax=Bacillus sp. JJ1562 TaxID=3122960 RepID=UPI0030035CB7
MGEKIIDVKGLRTSFFTDEGEIPAVDHIDFHINEGEILGVVGESGCGKSVTSLSIMGLVPTPPGRIVGGEIVFNGQNLVHFSEKQMRQIRGNDIAMIFQEPMTSLNPLFTIGDQMVEGIKIHMKWDKKKSRARAIEIMKRVGLPRPEELMNEYPHQLSGGMRQRVMIAMAMACNPKLLIADEPTTALDVTIQSQILKLMKELNDEMNTAIMLITHDLGVVAQICERVAVMYAGKIVEEGKVSDIFKNPKHPYTKGLLKSVPDIRNKNERLYSIPGNVPKPGLITQGCRFAERCEFAFERCFTENPELYDVDDKGHRVRCFLQIGREESNHDTTFTTSP